MYYGEYHSQQSPLSHSYARTISRVTRAVCCCLELPYSVMVHLVVYLKFCESEDLHVHNTQTCNNEKWKVLVLSPSVSCQGRSCKLYVASWTFSRFRSMYVVPRLAHCGPMSGASTEDKKNHVGRNVALRERAKPVRFTGLPGTAY